MRAIDTHVHCWNGQLAPRVLQKFKKEGAFEGEPAYDGTVDGLLDHMDESGVAIAMVSSVATKASQVDTINKWLAPYIGHPRIVPLAAVHPDIADHRKLIEQIAAAGFAGIKLHSSYQGFNVADEHMFCLYETAIEHNLIMLFHAGATKTGDDTGCSRADFDRMLRRYPYERTIVAHLGGARLLDEVPDAIYGRPGYTDLAWQIGNLPDEDVVRLCRAYGTERVLFGTDGPWKREDTDIARLLQMGFSDSELANILYRNAANLLGLG